MALILEHDIIVFCHLRWNFVLQRPQHLITRFSQVRKVLFIEEPIQNDTDHEDTVLHPTDHITVIQPNISWPLQTQELEKVVNKYVKEYRLKDPILWFYSAACEEISEYVKHDLIVYDCMDELSAFAGAPQSLIDKEKKLLLKADIVFTGGKSLYDSKKTDACKCALFPFKCRQKTF